MNGHAVEIAEVAQLRCFELVELDSGTNQRAGAVLGAGASVPGAVRRSADGQLETLHFAPGRWLLPDPAAGLLETIARQPGAVLVDVEGKWQRRSVRGSGAMRLLAGAADVEAMLGGRDCAALSLFDCPAVVARGSGTIEVWVHSSYAPYLDGQLAQALSRAASRRTP